MCEFSYLVAGLELTPAKKKLTPNGTQPGQKQHVPHMFILCECFKGRDRGGRERISFKRKIGKILWFLDL